jgi:hypothetical protein
MGDSLIFRNLAEQREPQGWLHHVADAATGELLTIKLPQPPAPLLRAERLSGLGHHIDPSIFGAPTHRLTPRHPYQASPAGSLIFQWARNVSSFGDEPNGRVDWLLQDIVSPWSGRMDALLLDAPAGRCLLSLLLGAASLPGQVGHIRIEVKREPAENAPLIASFDLTAQGDDFNEHVFDLVFVSAPSVPPTRWAAIIIEPGSGLDIVRFGSLTLGPAHPVVHP